MNRNDISESFWKEFASRHWEKTPAFFARPFDPEILSETELFSIVTGIRAEEYTLNDRFWLAGTAHPTAKQDFRYLPLSDHRPTTADRDFAGYFRRIGNELGGNPVGINIHRLEKASPELWFRLRDFVHGLNRATGILPTGRWDIDTFFGTYRTTPLGIHKDNTSVFAIGILGARTYYTWPEEYFREGNPALSTLDPALIEPHLGNAVRMTLKPGDMVYWPSSNWHLIKSDGQPSAVVQISAILGRNLSEVIGSHLQRVLAAQFGEHDYCRAYTRADNPVQPPQELVRAHQALMQTVNGGLVAGALQQLWLMYNTADGLFPVPPSSSSTATRNDDTFAVDPRYPIAWLRTAEHVLAVSANGLNFTIQSTHTADIIDVLEQLNTGQPVNPSQSVARHPADPAWASSLQELFTSLNRCRAFRIPA